MKVKYIGDARDGFSGPDEIEVHGLTFKKNQTVNVDDAVGAKLATNRHFETTPAKADKNTLRSAADAVEQADVGSTTGDPETSSRQTKVAISEQGDGSANGPMGEPG